MGMSWRGERQGDIIREEGKVKLRKGKRERQMRYIGERNRNRRVKGEETVWENSRKVSEPWKSGL